MSDQPDLHQLDGGSLAGVALADPLRPAQADGDVVERAEVREQVELLEDHPHLAAQFDHRAATLGLAVEARAVLGPEHPDRTRRWLLEQVDRAQ
jgi:hypothetical protein